jgi:hypothetical protein
MKEQKEGSQPVSVDERSKQWFSLLQKDIALNRICLLSVVLVGHGAA